MLMGVSASALVACASHDSVRPSRLVPEVAFSPSMPVLGIGRAHLPGVNRRQPLSAVRMSGTNGKPLSRRTALLAAAAPYVLAFTASPVHAYAGEGTMSKEEVMKIAREKLTPLEQGISLKAATERPFSGKTTNGYSHDNKKIGKYVGAISGAPLFESTAKYDSGTGWPSFYAAVPGGVIERPDPEDIRRGANSFGVRTEIIDAKSGAHLGHVFNDGPKPTGKRYCMNAGAMTFVPAPDITIGTLTTKIGPPPPGSITIGTLTTQINAGSVTTPGSPLYMTVFR